jgi:hypothetical protein
MKDVGLVRLQHEAAGDAQRHSWPTFRTLCTSLIVEDSRFIENAVRSGVEEGVVEACPCLSTKNGGDDGTP